MKFEDVDAAPVVGRDRIEHLVSAYRQAPTGGLVVELGVFRGESINALAGIDPERAVFGFDSFRGLPEPWDMGSRTEVPTGHFALEKLPEVKPNVALVVGAFALTLVAFFAQARGPIDFLHVDCDLYRSTVVALACCGVLLRKGSVVVFDEIGNWDGRYPNWGQGEWRALSEYLTSSGRVLRPISRTEQQQAAFVVEV
jgi:hypothetical protein